MIKLSVEFKNIDKILKNRETKTITQLEKAMIYILKLIIDVARTKYLRGPYPIYLRIGEGSLQRNIFPKVEKIYNQIIGTISSGQISYYHKFYEDEARKGKLFKIGTPMYRPSIKPAFEDLRKKIEEMMKEEGTK